MSIAFVSDKDLTVTHEAVARHMRDMGEEIVWLCPSARWAKWLVGRGWPQDSILNFAERKAEWTAMPEAEARAILAVYEEDPSVTAAHIVRMCRGLRYRNASYALAYLAVTARAADAFLERHAVSAVLGEATWGFEIVTWLVAQRRGIAYMTPAVTRLPGDRHCLVDAVYGTLFTPFAPNEGHRAEARAYYSDWTSRPRPAPGFTLGGPGIAGFEYAWFAEMRQIATNAADEEGDETLWPITRRMADRARRLRSARQARAYLASQPPPPDDPYVLYCLQHQPEAAVDILGGFNSDQRHLIEMIVRMLPATHRLHIREHRAAMGDRPLQWYREVARLPGVVFVDPYADIWPQMTGSAATLSVSGTVLLEAAMLGVPALGLAPVLYSDLLAVKPSRMSGALDWPLLDVIDPAQRGRWAPDEAARIEYLAKIFANSGKGDPSLIRVPPEIRNQPDWQRPEAEFLMVLVEQLRNGCEQRSRMKRTAAAG